MSFEVKFKVEYHREGSFYTVRGKRLKDLQSLKRMRNKIVSVSNVDWKWHVVLTFNDESLNYWFRLYKDVGKALSDYFDKIRKKFWGVKYFWKYEEGTKVWCSVCNKVVDFEYDMEREGWVICKLCGNSFKNVGERPHYHLLFDFVNRGIRCKGDKIGEKLKKIRKKNVKRTKITEKMYLLEWKEKECNDLMFKKLIFPQNWDKINWKQWFKNQRKYKSNRDKTDMEMLMGYWHYQKWGYKRLGGVISNGSTFAREIKSYMDLKKYVKKDFFKFTESKWLKADKRKWSSSQNLLYDEEGGIVKEWEQVLETIGYFVASKALEMVEDSKDNMIGYYNEKGMKGEYIYKRVVADIRDGMADTKGDVKNGYRRQETLDIEVVGVAKCRYCEKEFDVGKGYVGIYCSKGCFMKYSRSLGYRMEKMRRDRDRKDVGKGKR